MQQQNSLLRMDSSFRGRGRTLLFSYIRRLGSFLGVQNFVFQYFGGFSEKLIFFRYEDLWIFFGGHHKIGLNLAVISMHFRVFA